MEIDVIDLNFKQINFNRNYDSSRYFKARKIYNNLDVIINTVQKLATSDGNIYKINSEVNGNYDIYRVYLELNENNLKKSTCTCADYDNGNFCKHILATCMEVIDPHNASTDAGRKILQEEMVKRQEELKKAFEKMKEEERKKREYDEKYSAALNVLKKYESSTPLYSFDKLDNVNDVKDLYERIKYSNLENGKNSSLDFATNISIIPKVIIKDRKSVEVQFKIGETTKYVLKDISAFYKAFLDESELQYGKKLKFIAKRENFCETDRKLLDYILKYGSNLEFADNIIRNSYYYYSLSSSTKSMIINDELLDEFFEILRNRQTEFVIYNSNLEDCVFVNDKLLPKIKIEKLESGDYNIKLNYKYTNYIETAKYIYVFFKNIIYTIDKKQNPQMEELLNIFLNKDEILVPNDRYVEFSKKVLTKVDRYIDIAESSDEEDNQNDKTKNNEIEIYLNKLASKVYLDLDDEGNILLLLKFCYQDKEFNILDKNFIAYVKDNNVLRDVESEKAILTRIFNDGFQIDKKKERFILSDLDYIYDFLSNKIEDYMQDFEVLVTEKFKNKKIKKPKISTISVRIDNGLLEFDMSKTDMQIDEIKNILQSYNIKKKYYKLKNGDFLDLEQNKDLELLNEISSNLDVDFSKMNNGVVKLPVNRTLYLEKLLNTNNINTSKNDEYNKLVNNISNKNFSDNIVINKEFENVLRDYQKTGYKWLKVLEHYGFGGILADDMGLGKTLQVIALLESNSHSINKKPSIVVCPSSLVLNWKNEVSKWCNRLKVLIVSGDAITRKNLIKTCDDYDLVITSYDLLKRDIEEYEDKHFKYIIADEAQYIKNFSTQNATALKSLDGQTKFALTGTPIENSVAELWSIFDFCMPGYLYSYTKFKKKFEAPIIKNEDEEALKKLKLLIEPFVLRRVKKDVLTELPDKNITILNNEMTDEQQKLYFSYLAQIKEEVASEVSTNGFEKSKFKILMLLTRLRQICCHPSMFIENYNGGSGKLMQCLDILAEALESGHKVLLFSQYTSMFEIIEEHLNKMSIAYYKLTGNTPVSRRIEMVDDFNKNEDIKVFLISLKAGGTGLNLTGADVVIHYDPWWNVSSENQATDRAYRIGQKNSVQVYKLITTNSIEEKINKLQERKAKLSEELLSTEETFINKLSKEDIMALFE